MDSNPVFSGKMIEGRVNIAYWSAASVGRQLKYYDSTTSRARPPIIHHWGRSTRADEHRVSRN